VNSRTPLYVGLGVAALGAAATAGFLGGQSTRPAPPPVINMSNVQSASEEEADAPLHTDISADERESIAAPPELPAFDEFRVEQTSKSAPLRLRRGSSWWDYRTRVRDAYAAPTNFSANATVAIFGCGMGCRLGFLVDRTTGRIHGLPLGGEDNMYLDTYGRPGSNLLLAAWEDDDVCVFEAYEWSGSDFVSLAKFPQRARGRGPPYSDE
jgi:hypothetical protein